MDLQACELRTRKEAVVAHRTLSGRQAQKVRGSSGVHGAHALAGKRTHQSSASIPSAFPPCGLDVGLYGDCTVVGCLVKFLNVKPHLNDINFSSFVLGHFSSLLVLESKELGIRSTGVSVRPDRRAASLQGLCAANLGWVRLCLASTFHVISSVWTLANMTWVENDAVVFAASALGASILSRRSIGIHSSTKTS